MHAQPPDNLTITRLLVLTAGVAVGLAIFARPEEVHFDAPGQWVESFRMVATAALLGVGLMGLFLAWPRHQKPAGLGSLSWLAQGFAVLALLPPALVERCLRDSSIGLSSHACLFYMSPLMAIWVFAAGAGGRRFRFRHMLQTRVWSDRAGLWLVLAWLPLGLWVLFELYWGAIQSLLNS